MKSVTAALCMVQFPFVLLGILTSPVSQVSVKQKFMMIMLFP